MPSPTALPRTAIVWTVLAWAAAAQPQTLTTTLAGGNGQKGNMFDVVNLSPATVTILSFDQNFLGAAGSPTMEIWIRTGGGSHVGSETTAANWTLVATAPNVAALPQGTLTPVPVVLGISIPPGATQGFYVTCTSATTSNVAYTNGTSVGAVAAADIFIQILEGTGNAYPFAGTFQPRIWNGRITYAVGGAIPEYEVNDAASSLDGDGVQGNVFNPAVRTLCTNSSAVVTFSSTGVGLGWEVGVGSVPLVPASGGATVSAGGQITNLPQADPGLVYLNGGPVHSLVPFPFPTFSAPFSTGPVPRILTAQQLNIDPGHSDGSSLSQPLRLDIAAGGTSIPGPAGDDSSVSVQLGAPPLCGPASLPFFGTSYTRMEVISNGRVMFGTANISFVPTVAQALTDSPFAGAWADFNPATGGTITISAPNPALVRVDWAGVPYFGAPGTLNTFGIMFDIGGTVTLDGLAGIQASAANQFMGVSAGNTGATDPGVTNFTLGGPNPGPSGLGMIYNLGITGSLAPGINILSFLANPTGNFDWFGA